MPSGVYKRNKRKKNTGERKDLGETLPHRRRVGTTKRNLHIDQVDIKKRMARAEAQGMSPLELMLQIMRDETETVKLRLYAAICAAPYVHPKLNTVTVQGQVEVVRKLVIKEPEAPPTEVIDVEPVQHLNS